MATCKCFSLKAGAKVLLFFDICKYLCIFLKIFCICEIFFVFLHQKFIHMNRDTEIFDVIRRERERQTKGIELIASENFVSDQVMEAMGSVLTNKYA